MTSHLWVFWVTFNGELVLFDGVIESSDCAQQVRVVGMRPGHLYVIVTCEYGMCIKGHPGLLTWRY